MYFATDSRLSDGFIFSTYSGSLKAPGYYIKIVLTDSVEPRCGFLVIKPYVFLSKRRKICSLCLCV